MIRWILRGKDAARSQSLKTVEMKQPNEGSALVALVRDLIENKKYSLGPPWTLTSESLSAVVPILRHLPEERIYVVLQEIPQDKAVVVDSGNIERISARLRNVDKPVFVRAGTVFKGQGTQSRTSQVGVVLIPNEDNTISTFCVHASHPISFGAHLESAAIAPTGIEDVLLSFSSQSRVWQATARRQSRAAISRCPSCGSENLMQNYATELFCVQCGSAIPRPAASESFLEDNLVANLEEMSGFNQKVENLLSRVPADEENQVGIVVLDSSGPLGLEMFDHPDSWRAFSKSIIRNYSDVIVRERAGEGLFALKTERIPEAVHNFLKQAETLKETTNFRNKKSETRMLSGRLVGEYTTIGHRVVHVILKRKNNPNRD